MSEPVEGGAGVFAKLWRRLKGQIVGEVPLEVALCECDCRKPSCLENDWAKCERRLAYVERAKAP